MFTYQLEFYKMKVYTLLLVQIHIVLLHSNSTMVSQPHSSSQPKLPEESDFPFMRDVADYEKIIKIGHGTFGSETISTNF